VAIIGENGSTRDEEEEEEEVRESS